MAAESPQFLRKLGGTFLVLALGMLVAGEVFLKGRLSGVGLLVYWSLCVLLTGGAMMAALLDLRRLRRKGREAQLEMLQDTLKSIETERKRRGK
jgi:hypothetical protein